MTLVIQCSINFGACNYWVTLIGIYVSTWFFLANESFKVTLTLFVFQVIMIVMCSLVLAIHSIFQPYRKKRVNVVETLYLYVLCIMAIMQVLQEMSVANSVCSFLLIITTIHSLALAIYKAVGFFQRRFKRPCPKRCEHWRKYGSMGETQFEESIDPEQKERKNIFDIIFSKSDDVEDSFGK